jgi:hypothetical protein
MPLLQSVIKILLVTQEHTFFGSSLFTCTVQRVLETGFDFNTSHHITSHHIEKNVD